jgi:5-methylcytosine-specific restriction endonuclease McrA
MTIQQFTPEFRVCKTCQLNKPINDYSARGKQQGRQARIRLSCKICMNEAARQRYGLSTDAGKRRLIFNAARIERLRQTEEGKQQIRDAKNRYRASLVAKGLTTNGTPRKNWRVSDQEKAQRKAGLEYRAWNRKWLIEAAPAKCVEAVYELTGKPWNNPRLSSGEKFALRYERDTVFRAREVLKAQRRKVVRSALIEAQSDGSVTPQSLGRLYGQAKECCYCGVSFKTSKEKTADHIVPISRGGLHSILNLVICCISCNSSKCNKMVDEWRTVNRLKLNLKSSTSNKRPSCSVSRRVRLETGQMPLELLMAPTTLRSWSNGMSPN